MYIQGAHGVFTQPQWTTFYGVIKKKTVVHSSKPRSLDELKVRITKEISEQQLQNVFNESEYRFELCVPNDGSYGGYVED